MVWAVLLVGAITAANSRASLTLPFLTKKAASDPAPRCGSRF
jgi:hypothetical protein